jgi:ketosteroid isomerase-like protein
MSAADDLVRLGREIRRLADREAIVELHHRFGALLDAGDYEHLGEVFVDDAVVEGWDDVPWRGTAQILERLAAINADHAGSHHMITNHRIRVEGDRGWCVAYYRSAHLDVDAPPGPIYKPTHSHEGWYLTELRRTDPGWRFSRLRHVSLTQADPATPSGRAITAEILAFVPL